MSLVLRGSLGFGFRVRGLEFWGYGWSSTKLINCSSGLVDFFKTHVQ